MPTASSAPASDPACPRFFYGWVVLIACFIVTTVASGTMMGFGVFITPMAEDMGWSHSALSFSYSLSAIVTGIGILIVGSFLHTHSVRLIFFLSTIVHCFGIYMTSTATTVEAFYFWYGFVASAGRSAFFLSTATLITRWFEKRRGLVMGIMMSGNGVGPFIFSPVITWMIFTWSWQTAYIVLSALMTVCLSLASFSSAIIRMRWAWHRMVGIIPRRFCRSPAPQRTPPRNRPGPGDHCGETSCAWRVFGRWRSSTFSAAFAIRSPSCTSSASPSMLACPPLPPPGSWRR